MKKFILLLGVAAMFCGCASFEKQQRRAEAFYNAYPNELAKVCAAAFPVKERVIKGRDSVTRDTTIKFLTVNCPPNAKDTIRVKVPITKVINNTTVRVDTIFQENTAQVNVYKTENMVLGGQNEALTKQLADEKAKAATRLLWIIGLGLFIACMIAWKIYRAFTGSGLASLFK